MTETPRLSLPLLQAAQAQKHITVNEALVRLDGLTQLVLQSVSTTVPPGVASDGDCYGVPLGASGNWAGRDGEIALYSNGGWIFLAPEVGWQAWVVDASLSAIYGAAGWVQGAVALSDTGAAIVHEIVEVDHVISAGTTSVVAGMIPSGSIVFGVTGRVLQTMGGALTGWKLGVAGAEDRYGNNLSLAAGNWVRGLTSFPLTYYDPEDLLLTAEGADFVGGVVRLSVNLMRLTPPSL